MKGTWQGSVYCKQLLLNCGDGRLVLLLHQCPNGQRILSFIYECGHERSQGTKPSLLLLFLSLSSSAPTLTVYSLFRVSRGMMSSNNICRNDRQSCR